MNDCVYVNPDFIAEEKFGDWNSLESVVQAANYAKDIREQCLDEKRSMAFETVFSTQEKLDFIQRAKKAGFFIRLFFVCTNDPSINAQRVALRVMEGGHDVPISKIISRYYRSIAKCVEAMTLVERCYFYDNSKTDEDPALIFRVNDGKIAKTYQNLVPWTKDIANAF